MPFSNKDIVPMKEVRAHFTALAEEVCAGREKIITRNGKAYVAVIDAERLDYYHQLERQSIHLRLLDEAEAGLNDIEKVNLMSVAELKSAYGRDGSR